MWCLDQAKTSEPKEDTMSVTDQDLSPLPYLEPGLYIHYKGKEYQVLEVSRHSESLEAFVVYRALYGRRELWIRPYAMFVEEVQTTQGKVPRFRKA